MLVAITKYIFPTYPLKKRKKESNYSDVGKGRGVCIGVEGSNNDNSTLLGAIKKKTKKTPLV